MNEFGKEMLEQIRFDLHYFERYVALTEEFFEKEAAQNLQLTADGSQDVYEYLSSASEFKGHFPRLLRSSILVSIFSIIELCLNETCDSLKERNALPINYSELSADDRSIRRARKYLVKIAGVDFPNTNEWQRILQYQTLRNGVVHNNGLLKYTSSNKGFIDSPNHPALFFMGVLSKKDQKIIVLKKGFCEAMIVSVRDFFEQLAERL